MPKKEIKIGFWGTGPLAESAIYNLYKNCEKNNYNIELIITKPNSKIGREHLLQAPYIKKWGESKNIKVIQPQRLKLLEGDNIDGYNLFKGLISDCDICIVASYGKIIPKEILDLPKFGFINIHPSDLPKLRGPSPIENTLLMGLEYLTVCVMKVAEKMDSGDIILKNKIKIEVEDNAGTLEIKAGQIGGQMISDILIDYVNGNVKTIKQDESGATFCKFVKKENGEILLSDNIEIIKNKWRAFYPWPGIFFIHKHKIHNKEELIRCKISGVNLDGNNIDEVITKLIPESKKEMSFEDFKRGYLL